VSAGQNRFGALRGIRAPFNARANYKRNNSGRTARHVRKERRQPWPRKMYLGVGSLAERAPDLVKRLSGSLVVAELHATLEGGHGAEKWPLDHRATVPLAQARGAINALFCRSARQEPDIADVSACQPRRTVRLSLASTSRADSGPRSQ
jgi:hypothetical protein